VDVVQLYPGNREIATNRLGVEKRRLSVSMLGRRGHPRHPVK
jgi:hypothetical protein